MRSPVLCLIALDWQPAGGRLRVLANRDEFYARPTAAAGWWAAQPGLWAGRDLQAGGTWLGITLRGRFAALTNFREGASQAGKRSRGELVTGFLTGEQSPAGYLQQVLARGKDYAGFNLLVGDLHTDELHYGGNRPGGEPRLLQAGLYGLSNGLLNTPWPKTARLKRGLTTLPSDNDGAALALLSDATMAPDSALPETGVPLELERRLSSVFITGDDYGTRAQTVLVVENGHVRILEQGRGPQGSLLGIQQAEWQLRERECVVHD
ncbi:NRDE family protein [Oceanimonas baumannii]|uniref:NRDE family protein n=1 Tax=Oceanimonas baumannii TaxID=129578 RepID=UPI001D188933|nr:NRDE family protein [Oceanimonas baumannii]MCC4265623.1 NRDE family protein [Oceanimonas baumannii]